MNYFIRDDKLVSQSFPGSSLFGSSPSDSGGSPPSPEQCPRLVISLPMDVMIFARICCACPKGAYSKPSPDGKALLVFWQDAQEKEVE